MIELESRPRLAPKVRLRFDAQANRYLLLYPERGIQLNGTGADIVKLCTGEHTVAQIIAQLTGKYCAQSPESIEREVLTFLEALSERMLIRNEP